MASNLLSRFMPPGNPSVYEDLRDNDNSSDDTDVEERAGLVDHTRRRDSDASPSIANAMSDVSGIGEEPSVPAAAAGQGPAGHDEADDDVPMSLLVETNQAATSQQPASNRRRQHASRSPAPIPGRATASARANWDNVQQQQKLYREAHVPPPYTAKSRGGVVIGDPKEKALWRWGNVQNLDNFLADVYQYFLDNGIWSTLLRRVLTLLTTAFVVSFSVFLTACIDYNKLPNASKLPDVMVPRCMQRLSGLPNLLLAFSVFLWFWKLVQYLLDIPRLKHMHDFYHHLLEIPDTDIQTISWQEVVKRLMALRDMNLATTTKVSERHRRAQGGPSKERMDAHDIANRLMRRDNYLIAMINKEILDTTVTLPFFGTRELFSTCLEWSLSLCILDFMFDERNQVSPQVLKDSQRRRLSDGLRRRFILLGAINLICAPFIIVYLVIYYFFRYFNEYHKNPSSIGLRQYSLLAEWKFREFNELWHLFEMRRNMSYPFATRYINQFPKDKTNQVMRFVAFVTGALAAVLALVSLVDPDLFLGFEITPDRTVLFYLGVLGAIWSFSNGSTEEENLVFDPEYALTAVVNYTHYHPASWKGKLHSDEVRKDFAQLYPLKAVIFLQELLSIITTPFILWFSLPRCSDRIVDFFREFTVHVDGVGYVCSFAVFDFDKGGNNTQRQKQRAIGDDPNLRDDYYSTKDGKMLASYYNFVDNYVTNPKQGRNSVPPGQHFHPPPAFPGLMTSHFVNEVQVPSPRHEPLDRTRPSSRYAGTALNAQKTPRFAPTAAQASPMGSILLDPQHQPTGASKYAPRAAAQSRLRGSRKPEDDLIEDDEEGATAPADPAVSTTGDGDNDDTEVLGDSWKTTKASGEGSGAGTSARDGGPGVLGLVVQFSRAQAEGQGAGAQM